MHLRTPAAAALVLACLTLGACREHNGPAKPIAGANDTSANASTSAGRATGASGANSVPLASQPR